VDGGQFYCLQKFIRITSHTYAILLVPFIVLGFDANDGQQSSFAVRCCNKRALFILGNSVAKQYGINGVGHQQTQSAIQVIGFIHGKSCLTQYERAGPHQERIVANGQQVRNDHSYLQVNYDLNSYSADKRQFASSAEWVALFS
jgi:hypothetical protein